MLSCSWCLHCICAEYFKSFRRLALLPFMVCHPLHILVRAYLRLRGGEQERCCSEPCKMVCIVNVAHIYWSKSILRHLFCGRSRCLLYTNKSPNVGSGGGLCFVDTRKHIFYPYIHQSISYTCLSSIGWRGAGVEVEQADIIFWGCKYGKGEKSNRRYSFTEAKE